MDEFDIAGKRVVICGKPGSGKTRLAFHLAALDEPERRAIWDPMRQFTGFPGSGLYHPASALDTREFARWLGATTPQGGRTSSKYNGVIIDEGNLVMKNGSKLPPEVAAHVHLGRHFGASWVTITRRLANLHTDVVELADYVIVFQLLGANDVRRLNGLCAGMGVEAQRLPEFHYLVFDGSGYTAHAPLPLKEAA